MSEKDLCAKDLPASAEEPLYVTAPVITTRDDKTRISSQLRLDGEDKELWFEVDTVYADYLTTDTLDAFVTASVLPAILRGRNICPRGPMSSKLYYNLTHSLIPLFSDYLGKPRAVQLIPGRLLRTYEKRGSGVLAGFSGGVDSFYNYYTHSGGRAPEQFCITHCVFNNVGSHGQSDAAAARDIFAARYARLRQFMQAENKPFIAVDSNLDALLTGLNFEQTYTIRNAVVSLLLQNVIGKAIYASSNTFSDTKVKIGMDMSKLDALIIPLFETERLDSVLDGAQVTRAEKTLHITEIAASRQYLDVCITPEDVPSGFINCSACGKCLRTIMTLDAYGKLDGYGGIFMLERYNLVKNIFLVEMLSSGTSLAREVKSCLRAKKYPLPLAVRIAAVCVPYFLAWLISDKITPRLVRVPRLARFINQCLAW